MYGLIYYLFLYLIKERVRVIIEILIYVLVFIKSWKLMDYSVDYCRYCGRIATDCPIVRSCTCIGIPRPMCDPRSGSRPCLSCVKYRYTWLAIVFVALIALPLLQHIMWRAHMKPISDHSRVVNLYLMSGVLLINLWIVIYMVRTFDAKHAVKYQLNANK